MSLSGFGKCNFEPRSRIPDCAVISATTLSFGRNHVALKSDRGGGKCQAILNDDKELDFAKQKRSHIITATCNYETGSHRAKKEPKPFLTSPGCPSEPIGSLWDSIFSDHLLPKPTSGLSKQHVMCKLPMPN